MGIRFTNRARGKFTLLSRHNFHLTEADVIETLTDPDKIESDRYPPIAQKMISDKHELRVIFRREDEDMVVITFYPGGRRHYED